MSAAEGLADRVRSPYASDVTDDEDSPPLLDSRADLEAILRQVADGITVQDVKGRSSTRTTRRRGSSASGPPRSSWRRPITDVLARFEMFDEHGAPFPLERLPGRLALRGIETEQVIRYRDTRTGSERWSIVRATPVFDEHGAIRFAVNAFHDVTARLLAERDLGFIAEAGQRLTATLDYEETLRTLAALVVPEARELGGLLPRRRRRRSPDVRCARRRGEAQARRGDRAPPPVRLRRPRQADSAARSTRDARRSSSEVTDEALAAAANDEEHFEALKQLGFTTAIVVPLETSGRVIGAMTLVRTEGANYNRRRPARRRGARSPRGGRDRERPQLRAGSGEGAREPGARVRRGRRLPRRRGRRDPPLEPCRRRAHGPRGAGGRRAHDPEALPGWPDAPEGGRPQTFPVEVNGRELWLSISRVDFGEGTVFAFRDLTDDRTLELLKSDFISTVSHELRTPLAAIYGAAMTVRRGGPGSTSAAESCLT